MNQCETCGDELPVEARWCDPCAPDNQVTDAQIDKAMADTTPEEWRELEDILEAEFPDETAKANRDLRRIAMKSRRRQVGLPTLDGGRGRSGHSSPSPPSETPGGDGATP